MDPLLKEDGLMILGNGRPASLLVGSMELRLELTLCAIQVQTQRARRLQELCVQNANEHKARWALAWLCTELTLQRSSYCRRETNIISAAIRCAPKSRS
jgi:hypothetical protein